MQKEINIYIETYKDSYEFKTDVIVTDKTVIISDEMLGTLRQFESSFRTYQALLKDLFREQENGS